MKWIMLFLYYHNKLISSLLIIIVLNFILYVVKIDLQISYLFKMILVIKRTWKNPSLTYVIL